MVLGIFKKIKSAAQKVGNAIASTAKKIGSGIKNVAQKVVNTGAKVVSKVADGASKVASFVAPVGTLMSLVPGPVGIAGKVISGVGNVVKYGGKIVSNLADKVADKTEQTNTFTSYAQRTQNVVKPVKKPETFTTTKDVVKKVIPDEVKTIEQKTLKDEVQSVPSQHVRRRPLKGPVPANPYRRPLPPYGAPHHMYNQRGPNMRRPQRDVTVNNYYGQRPQNSSNSYAEGSPQNIQRPVNPQQSRPMRRPQPYGMNNGIQQRGPHRGQQRDVTINNYYGQRPQQSSGFTFV